MIQIAAVVALVVIVGLVIYTQTSATLGAASSSALTRSTGGTTIPRTSTTPAGQQKPGAGAPNDPAGTSYKGG